MTTREPAYIERELSAQQQTLTVQQAIDRAIKHHSSGDLAEAESIYRQILQTDPNQPVALHLLGVVFHQGGQNELAVEHLSKALTIKPDYAEAHSNLGLALQELGRLEEAIASYHKAIDIKPDYAEAYNNLGNTLLEMEQFEEAITSCQKALAINPDYATAHYNLGVGLEKLGRLDEAVVSYNKALNIKPDYIDAYINRGLIIELQEGKKLFNSRVILDQCFAKISLNDPNEATKLLHDVCLNSPFKTQTYVNLFIDRWCDTIVRMLDSQDFDIVGKRIRWLYMLVEAHKPFDILLQRYFDETKNKKVFEILDEHENAVHLSMQSHSFYQNGEYDKAQLFATQCLEETKELFENKTQLNDSWLLVRKSLKHINDPDKAREILEELLLSIKK